mgnify:CR=1 FL=1
MQMKPVSYKFTCGIFKVQCDKIENSNPFRLPFFIYTLNSPGQYHSVLGFLAARAANSSIAGEYMMWLSVGSFCPSRAAKSSIAGEYMMWPSLDSFCPSVYCGQSQRQVLLTKRSAFDSSSLSEGRKRVGQTMRPGFDGMGIIGRWRTGRPSH